eukprot:Gb_02723 [translate_table: standard]
MALAQTLCNKKKITLFLEPWLQPQDSNTINSMTSAPKREGNDNNNHLAGVRTLCKQEGLKETLRVLHAMDHRRICADSSVYDTLLQGCLNSKALPESKLVHAHMIQTGFKLEDISLENKLVSIYAKCGNVVDARRVLDQMPKQNAVSWTIIIAAYARHGQGEEALSMFYQMQQIGIQPSPFTFASVLPACANLSALDQGKEIHEVIIRCGFQSNVFVGNALVDMYAKCGSLDDARNMFDKMAERDVVSWNTIIGGYTQNGNVSEALKLFHKMPERNVVSWNAMIAGYAQNGLVDEALELFRKMPGRNVVSWTAMIAACCRHRRGEEALALFYDMQRTGIKPNHFTFASVLSACASLTAPDKGKAIHEQISGSQFQSNIFVGNALVDMYAKCGSIENARSVFDQMPEKDVVSWNAMIAGYAQNGLVEEALHLLQKMPEQNVVSWNAIIAGYTQIGHIEEALKLFQKMPEQDVVSWNAIIAGFAKNGQGDEALKLFQKMPERDVVSWNVIMAGFAQNGQGEEALKLFRQMQLAGVKPNSETISIVLPACTNVAALEQGKEIHDVIIKSEFQFDIFVGSALVDMYAKCGSVEYARKVFDKMPQRDVVSWTAMIVGYAMHGCGEEALQLFEQMQHSGIRPDHVTFLGVLSACCHAGLVDEGWQYFNCMTKYRITPAMEHYSCMVDLLGRAGNLYEAQDFINKMPIKPLATVWGSLLGACRIYTNIDLAEHAAERLFELNPENTTPYVLLSNIYAAAGRWGDIEKVRKLMKDRRVKKKPGCSWIVVNRQVHAFLVGD